MAENNDWSVASVNDEWQPNASLSSTCTNVTVTDEMITAGGNAYIAAVKCDNRKAAEVIYRAMAALAPRPPSLVWTKDPANGVMTPHYPERDRIAALEADNAALVGRVGELEAAIAQREQDALGYADLVTHLALRGASLEVSLKLLQQSHPLPAFTADIPDPPRRPDGTLAPVAKPWTPPRGAGDGRRVGG